LPAVATTNQGTYENPPDLSAETWNKIRFKELGSNGTLRWVFTRQACMQCTDAACVKVCPTYARQYNELGFVTIDPDRCISCGRCVAYCPFEVPKLGKQDVSPRITAEIGSPKIITYKCNFCEDRVGDGLTPACAKTCPPGALQFGERADLIEQGHARVNEIKATYPNAQLYGENELGGLHVLYVLIDSPSVHGLPEAPKLGTYPESDKNSLPNWYTQAIADGKLAAFPPEANPEWYLQSVPGWVAPTLWSLLGVGVIGGGAALWWVMQRKARLGKEKAKS